MAIEQCDLTPVGSTGDDCDNPSQAGLGDIALLYRFQDITLTKDASNPRSATAIVLATGAVPVGVYDAQNNPFDGTMVEGSFDTVFPSFNKTAMFKVRANGAAAAQNLIDPILKNRAGYVLLMPTKNKTADGGFIFIGSEKGAKASLGAKNYTDNAVNGAWDINLLEEGANFSEVYLTGATYAEAEAIYEAQKALVV